MKRTGIAIAVASLALAGCMVKTGSSTWSSGNGTTSGPQPSGPQPNGQANGPQDPNDQTAQNGPQGPNGQTPTGPAGSNGQSGSGPARSNTGNVNPNAESLTAGANPDAPFVGNSIVLQAGERPSREKQYCDGAHDHCLPKGVLFAAEWDGIKSDDALVVIKIERGLWAWKRSDIVRGDFRGMETERATSSTLKVGATAIAFRMGAHWGNLPSSPADAIFGQWVIGKVTSIDGASKTYRVDGEPEAIPIVVARIVTSSSPLPPEP